MGKYDPLRDQLRTRGSRVVVMTLDEVADLVGGLPPSAYRYPVWWNNDDPSHSHSRSWGDAGYDVAADISGGRVTFTRRR